MKSYCTLKSMPIVAVALSGSKTSSQYLVSTSQQMNTVSYHSKGQVLESRISHMGPLCDTSTGIVDLHADLPAPDGPMSSNLRVGKESSDAIFCE